MINLALQELDVLVIGPREESLAGRDSIYENRPIAADIDQHERITPAEPHSDCLSGRRHAPPVGPDGLVLLYNAGVEIRSSALKHGCGPEDIHHAIMNALVAYDDAEDPYVFYLGPDSTGAILEVLTALDHQGDEIAFHAMPMRNKYRSLLP